MTRRLLISDANVLIDFYCCDLLDTLFCLPHKFCVPDVLFREELEARHADLIHKPLEFVDFGPEVVEEILRLRRIYPAPSFNDLMVLAVAKSLAAAVLTGDRALRQAVEAERQECRGTLWLLHELVAHKLISVDQALTALERMKDLGRRLPWAQATREFRALR